MSAPTPLEALEKQIIDDAEAFAYVGFKPSITRAEVHKKKMSKTDLIRLLTAYVNCGNNVNRLSTKVADPSKATAVNALIVKYGILKKGVRPDDLTLPRIAAAFAPVLLNIRKILEKSKALPAKSVPTTTPAYLCDPSLACLSESHPEILDFLIKFGRAIKDKRTTAEESDARVTQYANAAVSGASSDDYLSAESFSKGLVESLASGGFT